MLRMSRYLDLQQNCVLYGDTLLPQEAFYTTDTAEMKLVSCVFELARSIAELKLTETELALYSAAVLLSPGEWHERAYRVSRKSARSNFLELDERRSSACISLSLKIGCFNNRA